MLESARHKTKESEFDTEVAHRMEEIFELYDIQDSLGGEEDEDEDNLDKMNKGDEGEPIHIEKEIDETTFLENWPRSSALVNVFDRMALDQNDMHFIFNLMDLNGDGTIDESELAQVYLQLKQISDDPTWIALVRGSRSREHRRYHLQRATEVYGYVKFIKDIQADLEESLPAAHAIAQEAA